MKVLNQPNLKEKVALCKYTNKQSEILQFYDRMKPAEHCTMFSSKIDHLKQSHSSLRLLEWSCTCIFLSPDSSTSVRKDRLTPFTQSSLCIFPKQRKSSREEVPEARIADLLRLALFTRKQTNAGVPWTTPEEGKHWIDQLSCPQKPRFILVVRGITCAASESVLS